MITTTTAPVDAFGYGRCFEIAPGVFRDADSGELFVTDGEQTLVVRVTTDPADQAQE